MSKDSRRAVVTGAVCASMILVGVMFWPDTRSESRGFASPVTPGYAQTSTKTPTQGRSLAMQLSDAFEAAANRVSPAVVPIYAEKKMEMPDGMDEFLRRFGGRPPGEDDQGQGGGQTLRSVGSGVIARADGYILTNNHVVADAQRVTVIMEDGKHYNAKVVGTDPATDLAVIRIDAKNLPVAEFGTSANLRVGQWVIAVGNPFQLLHSVTAGIISATGRSAIGLAAYEDFIQTDASINPGNSGGALADLDGKVIGINTAIASNTGTGAGVGFAIPIDMAKLIMEELINEGAVTRGYLAVLPQDITEDLQRALKLPSREGALVGSVTPGGPGDKGGIERGDVIVQFEGKKVTNSAQLRSEVARADPKKTASLVVIHDGKERTLKVTLGERPTETALNDRSGGKKAEPTKAQEDFGLTVEDITPAIAQELGYEEARGAVVVAVRGGSPAADAGLGRGDLILEVDGVAVKSASEVDRALSRIKGNDSIALLVRRGDNTFFAPLTRRSESSLN